MDLGMTVLFIVLFILGGTALGVGIGLFITWLKFGCSAFAETMVFAEKINPFHQTAIWRLK